MSAIKTQIEEDKQKRNEQFDADYQDEIEQKNAMISIARSAGLQVAGLDEEGELQFLGTKHEWEDFDDLTNG